MSDFLQSPPELTNTFLSARWLQSYLHWRLPKKHQQEAIAELSQLGERAAGPLAELALQAERQPPEHIPFDAWGRRIDELRVSSAWNQLKAFSAQEGLVSDGYVRPFGAFSRLHQFAKLFLFHPSSAFFSCPLAMTDGAARVLEVHGQNDERLKEAFTHLTSRNVGQFWTSGQWMTEKSGGSDVSETSTIAKPSGDGYLLSGVKWFSSATTSEMALGLARVEGAPLGSKGLTLFYIPVSRGDFGLSGIEILRLKDKLGTRALPTAELKLNDCVGYAIGELDAGVKTVSTMLNITRIYNSICSVGQMARGLELLQSYASKRNVFGKTLTQQPLFAAHIFKQEVSYLASFLLSFKMAELLGKEETQEISDVEADILRLFTPVAKLFTAKAAVEICSEVVEGFGGAGYIETTGIPSLLRDAQVFPIWEGATNVLSLDVVRVLEKTKALASFFAEAERILALAAQKGLKDGPLLRERVSHLQAILVGATPERLQENARALAFHLAMIFSTLLMVEWWAADPSQRLRLEIAIRHWLGEWMSFEFAHPDFQSGVRQFFDT